MKFLTLSCKLIFIISIFLNNFCGGFCQACIFKRSNGSVLEENDTEFGFNLEKIEDITPSNKRVLQLFVENVKSIQSNSTSSASGKFFINSNLTNKLFELTLTDDFEKYEEYETKDVISLTITFECTTGKPRTIEFLLPIIDTNNNDPKFIDAPYIYKLSMPFPKGIKLDLLEIISARDIDLTNNKILFSLDKNDDKSNGFNAEWSSTDVVDKKLHYATLITTSVINLNGNITFNIFATDTGNPPRTTNTTVTIIVDKLNSIIKFNNPVYTANYTSLDPKNINELVLEFFEGNISLLSGADGEKIEFDLKVNPEKYQENFQLKSSDDYSIVQVILKNPTRSILNEKFIILILNAKKSGTEESTVLHISLPGNSMLSEDADNDLIQKDCDISDDNIAIIVLGVLLAIVTISLVINVIRNMRYQIDPVVKKDVDIVRETPPEMREVERPSSSSSLDNSQPRRSVTFIDEVEEIKVARL